MEKWLEEYKEGKLLVTYIWNKAKELLGDRTKEELLNKDACYVFKLASLDGSSVILEEERWGYVLFKLYDANCTELFTIRSFYNDLGNIESTSNAFECKNQEKLLEYIETFKKVKFTNIELLYSNRRLNIIKQCANEYLDNDKFSFEKPCYICLQPRSTDILSVIVNDKYHVTSTKNIDYNGSLNTILENFIMGEGLRLYEKLKHNFVEKFNLEIILGYEEKLIISKDEYAFEFFYKDLFGSRKLKISLNEVEGLPNYQSLKNILVEEPIRSTKSPLLEINYDKAKKVKDSAIAPHYIDIFNNPSDHKVTKRYYNVSINGEKNKIELDYSNVSCILLYPEIRDFIIFILHRINEKYSNTNMMNRILSTNYFGVLLDFIVKDRDIYPHDEIVDGIFNSEKLSSYCGNTSFILRRVGSIQASNLDNNEKVSMINNLCNGMTPSTIQKVKEYIDSYYERDTEKKKLRLKL